MVHRRNGYEEKNEEFGIYLSQENEFIIPIEILNEGLQVIELDN